MTILARLVWSAALVARWCWRTPARSGALLVAAGVISLYCSDADFLPVLALLVVAPLLLLSIAVTLVHRPMGDPTTAWPARGHDGDAKPSASEPPHR
jgi:hypothetical protein